MPRNYTPAPPPPIFRDGIEQAEPDHKAIRQQDKRRKVPTSYGVDGTRYQDGVPQFSNAELTRRAADVEDDN
ncbi:hypothetical protein I6F11_23390 [Ensifer sp. NBAIM29]|nr:hypothetical protein [Ensifer sp. NBAIM29]